jgi:hypothetical protein
MSEATFDDLRKVTIALCEQRGNSAAQALLWEFGGYELMDLPQEHWARFTRAALIMLADHSDQWYAALWQAESDSEELTAMQTRPQHVPAMGEERPQTIGAILRRALERLERSEIRTGGDCGEPKRPPLAYFSEAKRFDAFPGFAVTSDCAVESQPSGSFLGVCIDGPDQFKTPRAI